MGLSLSTALAFAVTVVVTLTLRPIALRLRITDKPGGRKQHIGEIPLVGGIAMFIGILVAARAAVQPMGRWALLVPAALLVIVGVGNADEREAAARITNLTLSCCMAHEKWRMRRGGWMDFHIVRSAPISISRNSASSRPVLG